MAGAGVDSAMGYTVTGFCKVTLLSPEGNRKCHGHSVMSRLEKFQACCYGICDTRSLWEGKMSSVLDDFPSAKQFKKRSSEINLH